MQHLFTNFVVPSRAFSRCTACIITITHARLVNRKHEEFKDVIVTGFITL